MRAAATEAGGAGTVGRQQQGGDRGKGDVRRKQASEEKKEGKPKVKEVTFSPKIATRDIEVRMKRIRGWLDDGARCVPMLGVPSPAHHLDAIMSLQFPYQGGPASKPAPTPDQAHLLMEVCWRICF